MPMSVGEALKLAQAWGTVEDGGGWREVITVLSKHIAGLERELQETRGINAGLFEQNERLALDIEFMERNKNGLNPRKES